MIHSLQSWPQLTRNGVPDQFRVIRMPLLLDGREVQVGETVGLETMVNRARLRMLYEQRRVEPVELKTVVTASKPQMPTIPIDRTPRHVFPPDSEVVTVEVPVAEEAANPRYQPSRQRKGVKA